MANGRTTLVDERNPENRQYAGLVNLFRRRSILVKTLAVSSTLIPGEYLGPSQL
jgi:hypothetical protein